MHFSSDINRPPYEAEDGNGRARRISKRGERIMKKERHLSGKDGYVSRKHNGV